MQNSNINLKDNYSGRTVIAKMLKCNIQMVSSAHIIVWGRKWEIAFILSHCL